MSWRPIAGAPPQIQASDGTLASGYYLKFYQSGTTTATNMATDSGGGTTLAKCQINASGYPINGSSAVFIPYIDQKYRLVLYTNATDADANTFGNADWDVDAIDYMADIRDELANTSNVAQGDALVGVLRTDAAAEATTVHNYNERRPVFMAVDYGASLSTTNGTDDWSTVTQAAIDGLPSDGGEIHFPPGVYDFVTGISSTKANVKIVGLGGAGYVGDGAVKFTTSASIVMFTCGTASSTEHRGWAFHNIHFVDSGGTATGAILTKRLNNCRFQDCAFNDFLTGYAIHADGTGDACIIYMFDHIRVRNCLYGVQKTGTTAAFTFIGGFLNGNNIATSVGIGTGDNTRIYGTALDNWVTGLYCDDDAWFINARLENNTTHIQLAANSRRCEVTGTSITGGTTGIQLDAGNHFNMIHHNKYFAPTTKITNNTTAGDQVYINEPEDMTMLNEWSVSGSDLEHKISNIRQGLNEDARYIAAAGRDAVVAVMEAIFEATPVVRFGSTTAHDIEMVVNSTAVAKFDDDSTAGNTRFFIYDVDNGQLERVSVGAADSGGTNYKVLRIPN